MSTTYDRQVISTPVSTPCRRWAALGVLTLAVVLLAVDGTVLALAVPAVTAALEPTAVQLLWIGDVYSFALAGLLITMGNLADRIGRKRLLLIGALGFGLASLLAALAPSAEWLIGARVLQGIAGATLMPSTLSLIRIIFADPRERMTAVAIWSAGAAGGAALGPLVGGALLQHFWWGSVFLINLPIMAIFVIAGFLLLPESKDPHPGAFDVLSAVLSLLAIIPIVYAIKELASHGFSLTMVFIAALGIGAGMIFVRRQLSLESPLLDIGLFRIPAFSGSIMSKLITIFAFSGLLFFFSQYLQLVRGYSPLQAGIRELPITLAAIIVVVTAGRLSRRFGYGKIIGGGLFTAALGMAALALAEGAASYIWLACALVLVGLGVGLAETLSVDAVISVVPKDKSGAASAVSETAYELGVALGIAILGSLLTVLYRGGLTLPPSVSAKAASAAEESLARGLPALRVEGANEAAGHAVEAFAHAMQWTSLLCAALLAISGVIAWRVIPSIRTVARASTH